MALQTFTAGQVLTAAQVTALQTNGFNQSVSTKTADHTLVAADKGTRVEMNSATATTITVDTDLFNAGDTLFIQNRGAGVCTITAGTATVSTSGSLALAEFQGGTLYFVSAGVAIFFLTGSAGGGVAALSDADISGTTGSPATNTYTGDFNFKTYDFTGSGTITFAKAGLIDIMVISGGGSSKGRGGGGGSAVMIQTCFVPVASITVTIGAGGAANQNPSRSGEPSSFGVTTNTAIAMGLPGGGGANDAANSIGLRGSSGGGGTEGGAGAPALVTGLGFAGGNSTSGHGGGGGGASAAGTQGPQGNTGGNGGNGATNSFRTGSPQTFGGGGAGNGNFASGTAGSGGGGASQTNGSANTGGGAGGNGASGGSGRIVIRVLA